MHTYTDASSLAQVVNTAIVAVDALRDIAADAGRLDVAEPITAALIPLHDARAVAERRNGTRVA